MNETYRVKAIILNRQPFRECDSRVTLYSAEKGKLEFVARGVRKINSKLAAHLEPLNLSEIMAVRGRHFDYIGAAVSEDCFIDLKNNLEKSLIAGRAINIFNKLIKNGEKDSEIFHLLQSFLRILDENEILNCELLLNFFILKLLVQLGYKPELHNCVVCKNKIAPKGNKFDLSQGGLVCADCQKNIQRGKPLSISANCIKVLRLIINNKINRIPKIQIDNNLNKEISSIINLFLNYYK